MNRLSGFVSLHPYFKVPPDKMPHLKAILPEFAAKTRNETDNLFYEFTINGDEVFCREGYVNAEALLAHLDNVSAMLFFFSSRRRHTRYIGDWSSDVCSSD